MEIFTEGNYQITGEYENFLPPGKISFGGQFTAERSRKLNIFSLYGNIVDGNTERADIIGEIDQQTDDTVITFTKDYRPKIGIHRVNYELRFNLERGLWVGRYDLYRRYTGGDRRRPIPIQSGPDWVTCQISPQIT